MSKNYKLMQARTNYNDKTYWIQIGYGSQKGERISIKLDTLPLPNKTGEVWLQLYERTSDDGVQEENANATQ